MKTWQQRVLDTITYIRNLNAGPNQQYAIGISQALEEKNQGNLLQVVGEQMAQGHYKLLQSNADQEGFRMQRRALILIQAVLLNRSPHQAVATANATADANLGNQIGIALGLARQAIANHLDLKWNQFINNPAVFLQHNQILVRTTAAGGVVPYEFGWSAPHGCYRIEPVAGFNPHHHIRIQRSVNHIPVTNYPTVKAALNALAGVAANPAHPVVTTQLTGCSYVYRIHAGGLTAAHLYPAGDIGAVDMAQMLRGAPPPPLVNLGPAEFAGTGVAADVFGAAPANTAAGYVHAGTWTYVVGIRIGGLWQLHAQQQPQGGGIPTYWRIV